MHVSSSSVDVAVEDDHHELEDDQNVQRYSSSSSSSFSSSSSPPQIQGHDAEAVVGEDVHIGCETDAENEDDVSQDVVADVLVVSDIVDVQFDVN